MPDGFFCIPSTPALEGVQFLPLKVEMGFRKRQKPWGSWRALQVTSLHYVLEAFRGHVTPVQHMASSTWHLLDVKFGIYGMT